MSGRIALNRPSPRAAASLRSSFFLSAFETERDRQEVQAVAIPARAARNDVDLVNEGVSSDMLYVLTEGWACRYKTLRDGSRQIVALVTPGEVANLDTIMSGCPTSSVRTLTPAKVVPIPCADLLSLATDHPGIGRTLTRLALVEAAILGQWALCLGRMSAQQRLAHLLCEMEERLRPPQTYGQISFRMPLTQEQIADALGLTAVHVNRTLQHLRAERLVTTTSRTFSFPDAARLRHIAEFDASYLHGGRQAGGEAGLRAMAG